MENKIPTLMKPRIAFLFLLAVSISILFYWMIKSFLMALLVAAIFAGLLHPFFSRVSKLLGGRKVIASVVTVLLCLFLVIIPMVLFIGILAGQAIDISGSAGSWINRQVQQAENIQKKIEEDPYLKQLLPYQDEIVTKAGQIAAKMGTFVADGLATTARSTAEFFLMLFVMLYAMFNFLIDGRAIIDEILRFTPLSAEDQKRLLGTYVSVGRATLKGTLIIGLVQGSLGAASFWVAGIGGVVFWGAVMAVLSILPGIGAALVWIPAVIYLALNGQTGATVGVALWCAIVVGTADNMLRPLLVGKDTEMPDLLVMLTTLGGLALFGFAGILVGPLIGALYMTVWKLWGQAIDEARSAV